MKKWTLLLFVFVSFTGFAVEKVRFHEMAASAVSQSNTIAEGRCLSGSFYSPYVYTKDSALIVVNIEIDKTGKVVLAELDSTSVFGKSRHTAKWLANAHIAAAKKLRFNRSTSLPERQKGQVRYVLHPKN